MIRKIGECEVSQRTSDGFFNASYLLQEWNNRNPSKLRKMDNFWKSTHLEELMVEIAKNELNFTSVNPTDVRNALTSISKARLDRGGGTWMHPILFVKFAMYLNPAFEYQVIKFIADQMIDYRKQAGDAYKSLSSAVSKIVPNKARMKECFSMVGMALNYITFNTHSPEQRNFHGTAKEQQDLLYNEKYFSDLINQGFINNFDELIEAMRKKWVERWMPKTFLP